MLLGNTIVLLGNTRVLLGNTTCHNNPPFQRYEAATGATVIFSCFVDNIDGIRGQDWDVQYKIKQPDQSFRDISQVYKGRFVLLARCC